MATPNELRLFISSTFRDLHDEREHLVKKIFPEIRSLCRERGIVFTEVDLRWGLTKDEGTYGQIIGTCLEEVDACRPYFIGIIGSRYGYVPSYAEIQKDPVLLRQFPWIEDAVLDGASITDMEVRYGVLDDPLSAPQARFYFRRHRASLDETEEDEESQRLDDLKDRIRATEAVIQQFRDPASLGELVYDDLIEIIKRDFAGARPPTPLEAERARHTAFAASRRRAYIANPDYLKRLDSWLDSEEPPLVIYAESGSGKSSLVSFWTERLRRKHADLFVVEHYVGIGAGDQDHLGLIKHIMEEIKERFDRQEDLPEKPEEIEQGLGQWLGYAVHGLTQENSRMLLVLDALDQLGETALNLLWIPDEIDPKIRLVLTSTVEEPLVKLRRRKWKGMGVQPLKEAEREAVVVRYLSEYHKKLPTDQVVRIASDAKCAHPLFLRTLLEELRVFGLHDHLGREIDRLLSSTGTEELFQHVLERIEGDFNTRSVGQVMRLLWASRGGLNEQELSEMTGISRLKLATMVLGLDYHLVRTGGMLTFFHDYLRRAVQERYLGEESTRIETWESLAAFFKSAAIEVRSTRELLEALEKLGDREGLRCTLAEIERFAGFWESDPEEVLRLWSKVALEEVVVAYEASLAIWEAEADSTTKLKVWGHVSAMYGRMCAWGAAEEVERRRVEESRRVGDRQTEARALVSLAHLLVQLHRYDEAREIVILAESVGRALGDDGVVATATGVRGFVHYSRREHEDALKCYLENERMCTELGDRRGIARAIGNRGHLHASRREYAEALKCTAYAEELFRELGDRGGVSLALGNRGVVHFNVGQYEEALLCFARAEQMFRELGDRHSLTVVIGSRGNLFRDRGEFTEALECYAEQEPISREIGDRNNLAVVTGNRGLVYFRRGEQDLALSCFSEAIRELRAIGQRDSVASWLKETANALLESIQSAKEADSSMPEYLSRHIPDIDPQDWQTSVLRAARETAEECVSISEEFSRPETLYFGHLLLARVSAAEGDLTAAISALHTLLTEWTDPKEQAEITYWIWKLGSEVTDGISAGRLELDKHRRNALDLFTELYARTPKFEYKCRIGELAKE